MSEGKNRLFSRERQSIMLPLDNENSSRNIELGFQNKSLKLLPVTECSESEKILYTIIYKKDQKIQELTRKLKMYQTQLTQSKNQLKSKDYSIEYFKSKIHQEVYKSGFLEKQIQFINNKMKQFVQQLVVMDRLKNPLQIIAQKEELQNITFQQDSRDERNTNIKKINNRSLTILTRSIAKVQSVIGSCLNIKKNKQNQLKQPLQQKIDASYTRLIPLSVD